ncbi:hypothetical protein BWQ96_01147 [Gracilariopsis chorda]|uniref:Uncharacterized protein n=1 Tax=Gracilariopsis chorda TaxID=448386 RepID=A0A2V3J3R3_9FLOR|nr:hypothetical protein BWQ96_01147 [Gracilariopsis chorda]|eukprot:PXF49009.1 hypothetical protein BWQ96_01147 [Gracilariopsis chorda]
MVFIAIGALKAAKVAKKEYEKDKKRSQIIAPLDNSRRTAFDDAPASASPEWWGSEQTAEHETKPVEHPSQASFGAWSRDALMTRIAQQEARDDDYDARFREQLSNSSASLPSTAAPSASHSPALALRHPVAVPTEPPHSSSGSLKQLLPPTVSEPVEHQQQTPTSPPSPLPHAAQTTQSNPARKPPRPVPLPSAVEGSYEAALHSSSARSKSVTADENAFVDDTGLRTASSRRDGYALLRKPSDAPFAAHPTLPEKETSTVQGSFEEMLQDGTAHLQRFKSTTSTSDGANPSAAAQVSAFANISITRHREKLHSRITPLHNAASAASEEDNSHAPQQSAFATAQSAKKLVRRVSGIPNNSDNLESAFARTGSMRRRHGFGPTVPDGATKPQASARQKLVEANSSSANDQSDRTHEESPRTVTSSSAVRHVTDPASTTPPSAASCMSAVGSMKKRRSRRPNH